MKPIVISSAVAVFSVVSAVMVAICVVSTTLKANERQDLAPRTLDLLRCASCHSDRELASLVKDKSGNTDPRFVPEYIATLAQLREERHLPRRSPDATPGYSSTYNKT